jgi:enoyl-CoA hydratase/carnithine racemase
VLTETGGDKKRVETSLTLEHIQNSSILRIRSSDGTNRLSSSFVLKMIAAILRLSGEEACKPLVIAGNDNFFSAGADLEEIVNLNAAAAFEFSRRGQELMSAINEFPAPTYAAISGYCMGGGLDLARACRYRIASPHAIFGHRGAALGLLTGWGGTQRLPRLIGKGRALKMFVVAKKLDAEQALSSGLVDAIVADPVVESLHRATR